MLMFNFHIAFSLALIALAFGAAVLIWAKAHESVGVTLPKIIGYIVIIVAVLNILCSGYSASKYLMDGYFYKPFHPMMMQENMTMTPCRMMQMMQNMKCPVMSGQMMGNKMMGGNQMMENKGMQQTMPDNTAEHEDHHK